MCEKQGVNVTREEHATGRVEDDQLREISKARSGLALKTIREGLSDFIWSS